MDEKIERKVGDIFEYITYVSDNMDGTELKSMNTPVLFIYPIRQNGDTIRQVTERDIESLCDISFPATEGPLYGYLPLIYSNARVNQGIFERYEQQWGAP